jgi:redox-sensitive bicupin YhaK (pirin superfamily)
MPAAIALKPTSSRQVIHRTRGRSHGYITRLMSPSDLGELLKPFVFLDLFDNQGDRFPTFGLHPHSGLATLTYLAEGSVSYEDTNGATGVLRAGGVEWMRAGKGVWHSGGAGDPGLTRGFQLWVALPPHLELGPSESLYQSAADIPRAGPARVLLGGHDGATSAIQAPSPINYLAVTLKAGETWRYRPPTGHTVLWAGLGKGVVEASSEALEQGEIVVFKPGEGPVEFKARADAEFVIGSAAPHPHNLVLGYYSVHTSTEALRIGEARIDEIRDSLVAEGRLTPSRVA